MKDFHSPRQSTSSSIGSKDFSSSGGSTASAKSPLGRSSFSDHYIKPVPPTYVTEYEEAFVWPPENAYSHDYVAVSPRTLITAKKEHKDLTSITIRNKSFFYLLPICLSLKYH